MPRRPLWHPACTGLSGCNVSTAAPGVHTLAFSVQDSRGQRAAANRTLFVQQRCAAGERLCSDQVRVWGLVLAPSADLRLLPTPTLLCTQPRSHLGSTSSRPGRQVTCSVGGTCLADLAAPGGGGGAAGAPPPAAPKPPSIQLITHAALPAAVSIRQGTPYAACSPGQQPTRQLPCELGATAADGSGANLTAAVLACPPPSCLGSTRCPQALFASRGLAACSVDTGQPVGTAIQVRGCGSTLASCGRLCARWWGPGGEGEQVPAALPDSRGAISILPATLKDQQTAAGPVCGLGRVAARPQRHRHPHSGGGPAMRCRSVRLPAAHRRRRRAVQQRALRPALQPGPAAARPCRGVCVCSQDAAAAAAAVAAGTASAAGAAARRPAAAGSGADGVDELRPAAAAEPAAMRQHGRGGRGRLPRGGVRRGGAPAEQLLPLPVHVCTAAGRWLMAQSRACSTASTLAATLPPCMQGNDLSASISVVDVTCSSGGGSSGSSSAGTGAAAASLCWPCDLSAAQRGQCLPGRYVLDFTGGTMLPAWRAHGPTGTPHLPAAVR